MFKFSIPSVGHYYLFATGTALKDRYFDTQQDALNAMYKYCQKHNITVEITENDVFGKKFSNHNGIRFYINKVTY